MPLHWRGEGIGERFAIHIALLAEPDSGEPHGKRPNSRIHARMNPISHSQLLLQL